ncbi:MAG: DUF1801 domain-containing protein [Saonia sp.]
MDPSERIEAYFAKDHLFKEGIAILRSLAKQTELEETCKWGIPVYTIKNKNVLGICAFKGYFGLWFYNGAFLNDFKDVLENAQEGKTKAMRHWKFTSVDEINTKDVLDYMEEAIANQKKGIVLKPERNKAVEMPILLKKVLKEKPGLQTAFETLSPYKQKAYFEYIAMAKQEKTKLSRLEKILPMIGKGIGLHDAYRK